MLSDNLQLKFNINELAAWSKLPPKSVPALLDSLQSDGIIMGYFYDQVSPIVVITVERSTELQLGALLE